MAGIVVIFAATCAQAQQQRTAPPPAARPPAHEAPATKCYGATDCEEKLKAAQSWVHSHATPIAASDFDHTVATAAPKPPPARPPGIERIQPPPGNF